MYVIVYDMLHLCPTHDNAALTKALTCISKFGDDLTIVAGAEKLSLCATNSSMSAYCCFKYDKQFFTRYRVNTAPADAFEDAVHVSGQVLVKVRKYFYTHPIRPMSIY